MVQGKDGGLEQQLYMLVADHVCNQWGATHQNAGLVVGATDTEAMSNIRKQHAGVWILAPGIGAQGGQLEAAMEAGLWGKDETAKRACGMGGVLFPISRGISKAADQKKAAEDFREQMNSIGKGFLA